MSVLEKHQQVVLSHNPCDLSLYIINVRAYIIIYSSRTDVLKPIGRNRRLGRLFALFKHISLGGIHVRENITTWFVVSLQISGNEKWRRKTYVFPRHFRFSGFYKQLLNRPLNFCHASLLQAETAKTGQKRHISALIFQSAFSRLYILMYARTLIYKEKTQLGFANQL